MIHAHEDTEEGRAASDVLVRVAQSEGDFYRWLFSIARSVLFDGRDAPKAIYRTREFATETSTVSEAGRACAFYDQIEIEIDLAGRNHLQGLQAGIEEVCPRLKCEIKEMKKGRLFQVTIWGDYRFALLDCTTPSWKPLVTLFKFVPRTESLEGTGDDADAPGFDPPAEAERDPHEWALVVGRTRDALLSVPPKFGRAILPPHVAAAARVPSSVRNQCLFRVHLRHHRLADIASSMGIGIAQVSNCATLGFTIAAVAFAEQCGRRPSDEEVYALLANLSASYPKDFPW